MTEVNVEVLLRLGKYDQALEAAGTKLRAARSREEPATLALALLDEARAELALGDRDHAVQSVDEAISRARRGFGPKDTHYAQALELGAEVAAEADMPHVAESRFRAALDILEEAQVRGVPLLHAMFHYGKFRKSQGDVSGAARSFLGIIQRVPTTADHDAARYSAMAHTALGRLAYEAGKPAEARALGDRALETWLAIQEARRTEVADGMALVGAAALAELDADAATAFLETACEIYSMCGGKRRSEHATAAYDYARALDAQHKTAEAHAAYLKALDMYREGDPVRIEIEQRMMDMARS